MPFSPLIAASPSHFAEFRVVLLPLLAGAAAIYFLLPRPQGRQLFYGAVLGILALALAGVLIVNVGGASVETVLFYIFSGLAVVSGTLLITQQNPARAALSFTLVILSVCGLFLLLAAPFLMVATIIIYAGAIVVTFLFILMLAQQTGPSDADARSREPLLASLTGFILLGALLYVLQLGFLPKTQTVDPRRIDPFLSRIRAAETMETPREITDALLGNPEELNETLEKMRAERDWSRSVDQNRIAASLLAEELKNDHSFLFRLKKSLEILGRKDLADLTENDRVTRYDWPEDAPDRTPEKMREVLKNYEGLVQTARQDIGLVSPGWDRAKSQSGLSGPPSVLAAQVRRDDSGRPQAPADNSAHLGKSLFTDYLLPVELGGFLLLVATVGAIAIAQRHQTPGRAP